MGAAVGYCAALWIVRHLDSWKVGFVLQIYVIVALLRLLCTCRHHSATLVCLVYLACMLCVLVRFKCWSRAPVHGEGHVIELTKRVCVAVCCLVAGVRFEYVY